MCRLCTSYFCTGNSARGGIATTCSGAFCIPCLYSCQRVATTFSSSRSVWSPCTPLPCTSTRAAATKDVVVVVVEFVCDSLCLRVNVYFLCLFAYFFCFGFAIGKFTFYVSGLVCQPCVGDKRWHKKIIEKMC